MGSFLVQWLDHRYSPLFGTRPGCQTRDSYANRGLPWWLSGKGSPCNAGVAVVMDFDPWVRDPFEDVTTHSSILAWRNPWTMKPGELQSIGLQRIRHNWRDRACMHTCRQRLNVTISVSLSPFCSKNAVSWLISLQEKDRKNHWFGDWLFCICLCMSTCVCRCVIHLLYVIHHYLTEFLSKNRLRWKKLEQEVCKLDIPIYDKIQFDLGLFPRQTIQYHSNPSLCPNN